MKTISTIGPARVAALLGLVSLVLLMFISTPPVRAWEYTELQFFLLPEHCKAKVGGDSGNRSKGLALSDERTAYWEKTLRQDWLHLHHYCHGLVQLSGAQQSGNMSQARRLFRGAEQEIEYVRSRSNERSPLWGEMTLNYARAREGTGARDAAIQLLVQLRELHPDNAHTYVALAQTLERGQKLDEAVAVLEEGLKRATPKGPILFWLARYQSDAGNVERAAELLPLAEQEGMKMDSLRERLGSSAATQAGMPAMLPAIPAATSD
jgi:tetratricopeptide (TPR) repeat protein